jgi:EAL domain-containing protein (putative c-di-GMP-specific phosphodiesterase class I)/DNA-binding response OmpR family regulator
VRLATGDSVHPVLVVDDDPVVRRLLAETLLGAGLRVEEASTGPQAIDLAGRRPYGVVLLDSNLPGMSGLQVLARLRSEESTRTLPVLMVTGEDDVAARVRGLQQGADDYVVKPFHPEELLARVRAQMRGREAWAEHLERRLAERSAIAAALCRMHPEATAEGTAAVLCDEVRALRHLAGAALVVFSSTGVLPLALKGEAPDGVAPQVPLPAEAAARVRSMARNGPWLDHRDGGVAWAPFGTEREPVGALALVPVHRERGRVPPGAGAQLLAAAIDFAAVAEGLMTPSLLASGGRAQRAALDDVLRQEAFTPVYQPIVSLADGQVTGFEALTRFTDGADPKLRFAEAAALGRGIDLEAATLTAALRAAAALPPRAWLSVNVSPSLVLSNGVLTRLLVGCPLSLVLELTEHDPVDDYAELCDALAALRPAARLSVDDAGSGFASLRHVLALEPDFVKLDQSWVSGIHVDPARQALVAGLGHFASRTGAALIAEGIETDRERGMLADLDVDLGQGFLFGRPVSVPATT